MKTRIDKLITVVKTISNWKYFVPAAVLLAVLVLLSLQGCVVAPAKAELAVNG